MVEQSVSSKSSPFSSSTPTQPAEDKNGETPTNMSGSAVDALRAHLDKWYIGDSMEHGQGTPQSGPIEFYTIAELEALGLNILEKE